MTPPAPGAPDRPVDVIVAGGGPAGAAAARLLALRGRSVLLLTRSPARTPALAESLPPSCRKLLEALGATEAVEVAGFPACPGNTVRWGGRGERVRPFPGDPGWQADRGAFDRLLLELAREAGVRVRADAPVRAVELPGEGGRGVEEGPRVRFRRPEGGEETAEGRILLDASGRAGVVASRAGLREAGRWAPTTALVGIWRREGGWLLDDPGHTFVESYRDGWVWSIPVDPRTRYFTAMTDPRDGASRGARDLRARYLDELRKAPATRRLLEGGRLEGRPWARGATPYGARAFGGPGFLLVGDAGSFLDPLSSFGVKKALASGWLAAVAARTVLEDPGRSGLALEFFEERERAATERFHVGTAGFYREAAEAHGGAFWRRRAGTDGAGTEGTAFPFDDRTGPEGGAGLAGPGAPDVSALREDPAVRAAFDRLRSAAAVDLGPGPELHWTEGPAVRAGEVVPERRLRTPSFPRGLRYLREVDAVGLARLVGGEPGAPGEGDRALGVGELYAAYVRRHREVPLPDFLGALSVLLAEGALVNRPDPGGGERSRLPLRVGREG